MGKQEIQQGNFFELHQKEKLLREELEVGKQKQLAYEQRLHLWPPTKGILLKLSMN